SKEIAMTIDREKGYRASNIDRREHERDAPVQRDVLPPYDDPAFSAREPAPPPARPDAHPAPPEDTEFIGHPDFSSKAAENRPPEGGFGLEQRVDEIAGKTGSRKERF